MHRFIVSVSLALVVLLGLVATMGWSSNAQEAFATPGPGEFEIAPGYIGRELASSLVAEPPAGPVYLGIMRFTTEPGSVFTGGADDPSAGLTLVESGSLTARLDEPVMITRTTGTEEIPAGTEFTIGPGESLISPPFVEGEFRNDGQVPTVTLVVYVAPAEEEAATPMAGTPAP